ncbi:MAG: hypothetical protein PUG38_02030 [Sutterellaceae bacterium]|nr:hypothetical protein [Sutterellaceae bacterium]MDY2867888.1 hypothetical protein [Mesosutterella sp.]
MTVCQSAKPTSTRASQTANKADFLESRMQIIFGAKRPAHWKRNLAIQDDEKYYQLYLKQDWKGCRDRIREMGWELDDEPEQDSPRLPPKAPGSKK